MLNHCSQLDLHALTNALTAKLKHKTFAFKFQQLKNSLDYFSAHLMPHPSRIKHFSHRFDIPPHKFDHCTNTYVGTSSGR